MHDSLTGLPNRVLLSYRLDQELARTARENKQVAVFVLDLDKFKQINDLYGHGAGDALLVAVAERLRGVVRKMDTVARLGGDEFAIIQPGLMHPSEAAALGARIVQTMAQPFQVYGHEFVTSISVGITLSTAERKDPSELIRAADTALYRSKADGRGTYRFFEAEMDEKLRERRSLERDLREAIAKNQLEIYYQPLYTIAEDSLMGFEALLRWNHPTRGQVPPIEFIPLAEETSLIQRIGEWVLVNACQAAATWPEPLMVAVNVSPVQFKQKDLLIKVKSALEHSGLTPSRLEVEITENVLISETDAALQILLELKTLGVRVAMDDFGTGYSSLSYLRKFPFDKIKIDRSFINDLEQNEDDAAIVRAMVAMGQSLKMTTLAEGIESTGQLQRLLLEGCDQAQGFLLGRPMTRTQVQALILKAGETVDNKASLPVDQRVTESVIVESIGEETC
jgi:diguanylate cyclase (GGDEF)-like protein